MGTEFKSKVGGPELENPKKRITYSSTRNGVPIKEDNKRAICEIRRYFEKILGLRSWIDNI